MDDFLARLMAGDADAWFLVIISPMVIFYLIFGGAFGSGNDGGGSADFGFGDGGGDCD